MHPYVRLILIFLLYSYVKSHLDNDSCLPIYKTITAICNTSHQTCAYRISFFLTSSWRLRVVGGRVVVYDVGILQKNYFDKLDTRSKKEGTFCLLIQRVLLYSLQYNQFEGKIYRKTCCISNQNVPPFSLKVSNLS